MKIIQPDSKEHWLKLRNKNINSSEVPTLFNLSPYQTIAELWHGKKAGVGGEIIPNERMKWGSRLEKEIGFGIAEDLKITAKPVSEYYELTNLRIGSSFDFFYGDEGILEIKNVDAYQFETKWIDEPGNEEAPPHIELQVQHQMLVSNRSECIIGALVGGNKAVSFKRYYNPLIGDKIKERCKQFWKSIDENDPPKFNLERDVELIASLYNYANKDVVLNIDDSSKINELGLKYLEVSEQIGFLTKQKKALKAEIILEIKDAGRVVAPTFSIASSIKNGYTVPSYEVPASRSFKITKKKIVLD